MKSATAAALTALMLLLSAAVAQSTRPGQKPSVKPAPQQKAQDKSKTGVQDKDDDIPVSDQTLHLGTELVNVVFSAVDRNNHIVGDLRQEDVKVLEDGRPQTVFTFKREVNLPIRIAILIDLSGSQEFTFPQEKMAAAYFLHSIIRASSDLAEILTFREDVDLAKGLTSRIETVNRALDQIEFSRRFASTSPRNQATALYDAVYITADEILGKDEIRRSGDEANARRAIILLTDGVDNASNRKLEDAIDRAWRSGVMIYSIGIGDRFRFEGVREDVLRKMSEETGGRAYFPRNSEELLGNFRQIENEMRSQYLIAYEPSNAARDGAFRRIEVNIAGRSDVHVIHRRGYYAPLEDPKK